MGAEAAKAGRHGEDPAPPPPLLRRVALSVLAALLALAVGAAGFQTLAALRKAPGRVAGGPPLPVVRVETLRRGPWQEVLRGYGTARTLREARVTAEVAGVIRWIAPALRPGALVAPPVAGEGEGEGAAPDHEPLLRIDARDLEDQLERLEAEQRQASSDAERNERERASLEEQILLSDRRLVTARAEEERTAHLVPDTLPESELDRQRLAVYALEQVRAELLQRRDLAAAQQAALVARLDAIAVQQRLARRDLARTRVEAPFAGLVAARHVEEGARVVAGTPLFDVLDPARVEVQVALPAGRYGEVRAGPEGGSRARLRLVPDGDVVWEGRVARIDPRIDTESRTFHVYLEVLAEDGEAPIASGAPVVAEVEGLRYEDVIAVPREAFLGDSVYAVETGSDAAVAVRRVPRVLALLPAVALVGPGDAPDELADGVVVVVSNLEDIADGSRIRTVDAGARPEGP